MRRQALIALSLLFALAASPAAAFRNVVAGSTVDNPALIAMDGMVEPLLGSFCAAPTVVLFWATWSPRSAEALADLQQLYARSGAAVAAVNVDTGDGELVAAVEKAARDTQFPVFMDRGLELYQQWGVVAVPSMALVDGAGHVVSTLDGYAPGQRSAFLQEAAAAGAVSGDCVSASRSASDIAQRAN